MILTIILEEGEIQMICPFRIDIEYDYKAEKDTFYVKAQKERFPECYEEDCPFYSYPGKCEKTDDD